MSDFVEKLNASLSKFRAFMKANPLEPFDSINQETLDKLTSKKLSDLIPFPYEAHENTGESK